MSERKQQDKDENLDQERRLQVGAALGLGLLVLVGLMLRTGVRNVFPAGWWHHW